MSDAFEKLFNELKAKYPHLNQNDKDVMWMMFPYAYRAGQAAGVEWPSEIEFSNYVRQLQADDKSTLLHDAIGWITSQTYHWLRSFVEGGEK